MYTGEKTTMKPILLLALVFISIKGFSQLKIESTTSQSWVSGTCCSGGTNYRVVISGSENEIRDFNVTAVCFKGTMYSWQIIKSIQASDSLSYLFLTFNYRYSQSNKEFQIDQLIAKPAIFVEGIFYTLNGREGKLTIGEVKELPLIGHP
jgi:hypothetical protein